MNRRARLAAFLERTGCAGADIVRLVRDAGERVYYRIRPADGTLVPADGMVVPADGMVVPADGMVVPADGTLVPVGPAPNRRNHTFVACVMARPYPPGGLPFSNSTALYGRLGVRAPRIGIEAPDLGVLALEDLGDVLLQAAARDGDPRAPALYAEAVRILGAIQRRGAEVAASGDRGRYRAFAMRLDEALFRRELRFFVEHFVGPTRDSTRGSTPAGELDRLLDALGEEAAATPQALCHRDYHSRNLMVRRPAAEADSDRPDAAALTVIDHQDTRLGPRLYDLASLVRDPYVAGPRPSFALPLDETALVRRFVAETGLAATPAELAAELDTVALQRQLKALGTYGFQVHRRDNAVYRAFIAPTLAMVRRNLDRRPRRRPLRDALADLLDE